MVFRAEKSKDYSCINNKFLRNKNLSLKAKGLLSLMLSLPNDWNFNKIGLSYFSTDGKDAIKSAIEELKKERYLTIEHKGNEWYWTVYETQYTDFQCIENQCIENQCIENPPLQSTNNNKVLNIQNTNDTNIDGSKATFIPPTLEEIEQYCIEHSYTEVDPVNFLNYYTKNGWTYMKSGKRTPITEWWRTLGQWNTRYLKQCEVEAKTKARLAYAKEVEAKEQKQGFIPSLMGMQEEIMNEVKENTNGRKGIQSDTITNNFIDKV